MSTNMAAPMPSHHERSEICDTRPKYREGKRQTAVKVYTVNQESIYLLVQGVPAVGAIQELIKLFAVYGKILEYQVLDNHPAADKFTDVVLIKFERIQSARFAKKKMDDWGFYGGVLHVCYSPEYETVEDTRQKLKDRRISVASRIKRLERESRPSISSTVHVENVLETSNCKEHIDQKNQPNPVSNFETEGNKNDDSMVHLPVNFDPTRPPPPLPSESSWQIPLPPQTMPNQNPINRPLEGYEFARVPTAHATLPSTTLGGQFTNSGHLSGTSPPSSNKFLQMTKSNSILGGSKFKNMHTDAKKKQGVFSGSSHGNHEKPLKATSFQTSTANPKKILNDSISNLTETLPKTSSKVVVKNYQPKVSSQPLFVPRQAIKSFKNASLHRQEDELDKKIKIDAIQLGDKQGPTRKDGQLDKDIFVSPEESSVAKSQKEIRKCISDLTSITETKKPRLGL